MTKRDMKPSEPGMPLTQSESEPEDPAGAVEDFFEFLRTEVGSSGGQVEISFPPLEVNPKFFSKPVGDSKSDIEGAASLNPFAVQNEDGTLTLVFEQDGLWKSTDI